MRSSCPAWKRYAGLCALVVGLSPVSGCSTYDIPASAVESEVSAAMPSSTDVSCSAGLDREFGSSTTCAVKTDAGIRFVTVRWRVGVAGIDTVSVEPVSPQ